MLFELNPAGQGNADLVFSTFLGGTNFDEGRDIALAVDTAGRGRLVWVNGNTRSSDLPVTPGVFQATLGGDWDAFVSKIDFTDQFPCTRTLTGNVPGGLVAATGEIVCVNNASVTTAITVQPGSEVRIRDSRIAGSVTANQATAFTLCARSCPATSASRGRSPCW